MLEINYFKFDFFSLDILQVVRKCRDYSQLKKTIISPELSGNDILHSKAHIVSI